MAQEEASSRASALRPLDASGGIGEELLQMALQQATEAILCFDAAQRCIYANEAASGLFGSNERPVLGLTSRDLMPEAVMALLGPAATDGNCREAEFAWNERVFRAQARRLPVGTVLWIREVTERHLLEAALRESELRFRTAFDQMPMALTVTSLETGQLVDVNDSLLGMTGYTREEAIGRTPDELGLWVDPAMRAARFALLRAGRRPPDIEATFRTKGGATIDGIVASNAVEYNGRPCVLTCVIDITERKRAEEALSAAERQLRLIADQAPVLIACCDERARYKFVNLPYAQRLGLNPEQLVGKHIREVLGEAAYASLEPFIEAVLRGEDVAFEVEVPYRQEGPQHMRCAYSPERDSSGRVVGFVAAINNITDRKRIEEQLHEAHRRKDEFLASLAHELRNPLAPLSNALQIMRLAANDARKVEQARAMMERQLAQLVRLVDDLLDVGRIHQNKIELRLAPVHLAEIVEGAVEICQESLAQAGVTLEVELPPEPMELSADKVRLVQVLSNLLNNAAKFTPEGGQVRIRSEQAGEWLLIRVTDTGVGIPPQMLDRIFELFVQADRSLERSQIGLGIGLTIVKRMVELHGGRVEAASPGPGQGSEFRVWLPLSGGRQGSGQAA